jgi:hypothetical protein
MRNSAAHENQRPQSPCTYGAYHFRGSRTSINHIIHIRPQSQAPGRRPVSSYDSATSLSTTMAANSSAR